MASFLDLIAGKIAVAMGMITAEQMDEAIKEQGPSQSLSEMLVAKGFINEEQQNTITVKAKEEQERHDVKFARLAINMNFLTQEDVDNLRKIQQEKYSHALLRTAALEEGVLTEEQAQSISNSLKSAKVLGCPKCNKQYTQTSYQPGKSYQCPDCNITLVDQKAEPQEAGVQVFLQGKKQEEETTAELVLTGIAKGLDIQLPDEDEDELCGSRVEDYLIHKRLGAGAMGVVYKAEQIKLRRIVAMKMLSSQFAGDSFYIKRFMIEARSAAKLNHPHILQIYDADSFSGGFFFSMEFIKGESVGGILQRMQKLPPDKALEIVIQITQALTELYEHEIVHRDIKPDNIMLTTKGIAKLADLGLAKNTEYASEETGMVMGTPYYMAPEQISTPKDVDHRADIYSLGACFYRMLTGVIPFLDHDPKKALKKVLKTNLPSASEVNNAIPHSVSWVIEKMMAKNRDERFATPDELLEVLEGTRAQLATTSSANTGRLLPERQAIKIEVKGPIDTGSLDFDSTGSAPPPPPPPPPSALAPVPELPPEMETDLERATRKIEQTTRRTRGSMRDGEEKKITPLEEPTGGLPPHVAIIAIAAIVIILSVIAFYPRKKEIKKPTGPTPEEIRVKEFVDMEKSVTQTIEQGQLNSLQDMIGKLDSFKGKYPGSAEAQKSEDYQNKIREQIIAIKRERHLKAVEDYFQYTKKEFETFIKRQEFQKALKYLQSPGHKKYPELNDRFKKAHYIVYEKAQEQIDGIFADAGKLEKELKMQAAMLKLDDFIKKQKNKQFDENLQSLVKYRAKIEAKLLQIKKAQIALELQNKLYISLAKMDYKKTDQKLKELEKSSFKDDVVKQDPNAVKYSKQFDEQVQTQIKEYQSDIKQVEDWVMLTMLVDEFKNNKNLRKQLQKIKFVFSSPGEKSIRGVIMSIRKDNVMIQSRNVAGRKISKLTLKCKRSIITKLIRKKLLKLTGPRKYQLAMIALLQKNWKEARALGKSLAGEHLISFQQRLVLTMIKEIEQLAKDKNVEAIQALLEENYKFVKDQTEWHALKNLTAKILHDAASGDGGKKSYYRLIVDYCYEQKLFQMDSSFQETLEALTFSPELKQKFAENKINMSPLVSIKEVKKELWLITDHKKLEQFFVSRQHGDLIVYSGNSSHYFDDALKNIH